MNDSYLPMLMLNFPVGPPDGRRPAPVNHGPSSADNFLSDAASVVKTFMQRDPTEVNFSMLALASSQ